MRSSGSRIFMLNITMWLLASFFYAYQYVLRVLPNILMPDLMQKFSIDAQIFGQLSGLYYIGYAGMHIPIGIMLDKYGPKNVLPLFMGLAALGLLPFIYSDLWIYPCLGRLIIGLSSSAAILGLFKIIRMAFREALFTRMLGTSVTIGLLGAIYGGWPVKWLMTRIGWESTFQLIAAVGFSLAVLTYCIVPKMEKPETSSTWAEIKSLFTNKKILSICLLAGFMVGPLEGFADGWSAVFLERIYGVNSIVASSLPSMIFLGMCVGAPLLSYIADKTRAYFEIISFSGFVMGLSFILLLGGLLTVKLIPVVFFVVGVLCAYQIIAIYKASTYAKESAVGLTTAVANMIIMTFGYLFHSSIGRLMVVFWDGDMKQGIPYYSGETFCMALSVIPIMLIVAGIGFAIFAIKESYGKKQSKETLVFNKPITQ